VFLYLFELDVCLTVEQREPCFLSCLSFICRKRRWLSICLVRGAEMGRRA